MSSDIQRTDSAAPRRCSIAGALDVVGDRWSLLIVRELNLGVQRFDGIQRNTGAPRDMLTTRLRKLESVGILTRVAYNARPLRHEYVLTDAGRDLAPILLALTAWGDQYVYPGDPPVTYVHECGAEFHGVLTCAACGKSAGPSDLTPHFAEWRSGDPGGRS